jgi:hypothetical protein
MSKKQQTKHREERLQDGRCPVHGLTMSQVGLTDDGLVFIVGCPRKDCSIKATELVPFGPATLLPEHSHLLDAASGSTPFSSPRTHA